MLLVSSSPDTISHPLINEMIEKTTSSKGFAFNPSTIGSEKQTTSTRYVTSSSMATGIGKASTIDELKSKMNLHTFIFYEDKYLLQTQILNEYMEEFNGDLELILERAKKN